MQWRELRVGLLKCSVEQVKKEPGLHVVGEACGVSECASGGDQRAGLEWVICELVQRRIQG